MEKRNRRKLRKQFESAPLANYTPATTANGLYGAYLSSYLDGKPWFIPYRDVPRMMRDAQVLQGLQSRVAILVQAKWKVKSENEEVAKFVDSTITTVWKKLMPKVMEDYFAWGYSPSVMSFEMDKDNKVKLVGGRVIPPSLALPRVINRPGKNFGKYVGFDLSGAQDVGRYTDNQFIAAPHALWFAGNERRCEFFDNSLLMGAFNSWLEKNERGQGLASRQLYFRRCAFSLGSLYHPLGETLVNGVMVDNRDLATYISDNIQNGYCAIFPDARTPDDNRNEPQWRFEPGTSNSDKSQLIEYVHELDKEISIGLGIPPEVLEASEVGSGWSGRAIPRDMLFCASDRIISQFLDSFDLQVLRDMVAYNFGDDAEYELDAIPLVESMNPQNQQQQQPPGMPGGMPGMPQPGGEQPQSEGGGEELDGLIEQLAGEATGGGDEFDMKLEKGGKVPYVGKRGGRGVKDPRTGRIDYLSHKTDHQYGCVLCPAPQHLADMAKGFASTIPHDELADDGIENEPHVTVRYGLHGSDCETAFNATEQLGSLRFTPGSVQCFALPEHDVIYVSCDNADDWHNWHNSLEKIPNTLTHEDYVPHMTLAYLKPGCGSKYVGRTDLVADPVDMERVVYSKPDGSREERMIWPSAEQLETLFSSVSKPVMMGGEPKDGWKQRFSHNGSEKPREEDEVEEPPVYDEPIRDTSTTKINNKSARLNEDGNDVVTPKPAAKPVSTQAGPPLPFVPKKPKPQSPNKPIVSGVNPTTNVVPYNENTPAPPVQTPDGVEVASNVFVEQPKTPQTPKPVKEKEQEPLEVTDSFLNDPPEVREKRQKWAQTTASKIAKSKAKELAGGMDHDKFASLMSEKASEAMQTIGDGNSLVRTIKLPSGKTVKMTLTRKKLNTDKPIDAKPTVKPTDKPAQKPTVKQTEQKVEQPEQKKNVPPVDENGEPLPIARPPVKTQDKPLVAKPAQKQLEPEYIDDKVQQLEPKLVDDEGDDQSQLIGNEGQQQLIDGDAESQQDSLPVARQEESKPLAKANEDQPRFPFERDPDEQLPVPKETEPQPESNDETKPSEVKYFKKDEIPTRDPKMQVLSDDEKAERIAKYGKESAAYSRKPKSASSESWEEIISDPDLDYRSFTHPEAFASGEVTPKVQNRGKDDPNLFIDELLKKEGKPPIVYESVMDLARRADPSSFTDDGYLQVTPDMIAKANKGVRENAQIPGAFAGMWFKFIRNPGQKFDPKNGQHGDLHGRNGFSHYFPPGVTPRAIQARMKNQEGEQPKDNLSWFANHFDPSEWSITIA